VKNPHKRNWTEQQMATLEQLWIKGESASTIARYLGDCLTANAIIGKVHRMKLGPHKKVSRAKKRDDTPKRPRGRPPGLPRIVSVKVEAEPKPKPVVVPEPAPLPREHGELITILHISDSTCKWPIGDPSTPDFCFCGHTPREGSPYCEYHARLAHQPLQSRRMVTSYR
jgi:GcrA cell cycle regulator